MEVLLQTYIHILQIKNHGYIEGSLKKEGGETTKTDRCKAEVPELPGALRHSWTNYQNAIG